MSVDSNGLRNSLCEGVCVLVNVVLWSLGIVTLILRPMADVNHFVMTFRENICL